MSNAANNRNRWMLPARKKPFAKVKDFLSNPDVWNRIGLCSLITVILWVVMFGWAPPFSYRLREAPQRDLNARVRFDFDDFEATDANRRRARQNTLCFYTNDPLPLEQLKLALIDDIFEVNQKTYLEVRESQVWDKFFKPSEEAIDEDVRAAEFENFKASISKDEKLKSLQAAVSAAFLDFEKNGLLEDLTHEIGQGSMTEIQVYPTGNIQGARRVSVSEVRLGEAGEDLHRKLIAEILKASDVIDNGSLVAERMYDWLTPQLKSTLTWDEAASKKAANQAARDVEVAKRTYEVGDLLEQFSGGDYDSQGIRANSPLSVDDIKLLRAEHQALVAAEKWPQRTMRSLFFFGLFAAMFAMLCQYLYYRDLHLLTDIRHFALLLGLMLITLVTAWISAMAVGFRAEVLPIVIFALTIAIAYHIELAMMISTLVALAFSVAHGFGLGEFVILTTAATTSAIMCRQIRSRTKLVNVGLIAAAFVFPTALGVQYMLGQPLGLPLLINATWFAGGTFLAGLLMNSLLPYLEQWFDIQTDINLLEFSDANHPLLKELVQRAPGTYNHSINVASISEAAAEAIGANGLLCRVGAYFHDVGKLRKPDYFIENQAGGANKHDDLVPTMSTLVIIAHVKDGVEIAKKHRLPRRIIDLVEQHHGTTLVEYFYRRATKISEEEQDGAPVDQADYRYPGPKPQTAEAAVMMLADTVESASRALREPTPARLESLVKEISKKKFDDGQFDECPITVEQLHTIQSSLIKSLNAVYHARVKYPETQPA